jgi:hypothetical protein
MSVSSCVYDDDDDDGFVCVCVVGGVQCPGRVEKKRRRGGEEERERQTRATSSRLSLSISPLPDARTHNTDQ